MSVQSDKQTLINLLGIMIRARLFEEKALELFTKGAIPGFIHLGIGQEAVAAGVCPNLDAKDSIIVTHRGHSQCVAKGIDLKRAMAELFGKETGFSQGRGGSMHIYDIKAGILGAYSIVGAGIPIATGIAFSYKLQGIKQVVVDFFGDGAVNHGTFHESLNMASLWDLPVVYCCENNGYAEFSPQARTTKVTSIADRAKAYGMPSFRVDGDDVIAVSEAANKAINRARRGEGPTLLECITHRVYGHYAGDPQAYRPADELKELVKFDPIPKLESVLVQQSLMSKDDIKKIWDKERANIDEAVQFAEGSSTAKPETAFDDVYFEGVRA